MALTTQLRRMLKKAVRRTAMIYRVLGVAGLVPTARDFPIPYFTFKGSLIDPRLRASNDINAPSKLARYLFRDGG